MSYPNLEAEMSRHGVTARQIATFLHRGENTISSWMNGADAAFPIMKAKMARDHFFPNNTLDYLFSEIPLPPEEIANSKNESEAVA